MEDLRSRGDNRVPGPKFLAGFLIDGESCSFGFGPMNCGTAFYDLFTLENRTLEIWHDAVDVDG